MLDFLSENDRELIAKENANLEEIRIRLGQKAKAVFSTKGKRRVVSLGSVYGQSEIAEALGVSQVQISRIENKIIETFKKQI